MPDLENPLWQFALAFYQRPGVAEHCLELQNEHGVSVNQLLWSIWLGLEGRRLEMQVLENSAAQHWRDQFGQPVRMLRWQLRHELDDHPAALEAYRALKTAELASEKVELAYLADLAGELAEEEPGFDLVTDNMRLCVSCAPRDPLGAVAQALAELLPQAKQMYANK